MLQFDDATAYEDLIRYIQESRGIDFRGYKQASLQRRITLRMEQVGAGSFAAYHALLAAHPGEFSELMDALLINLTSSFRDPEAWEALRTRVLPALIDPARDREQLRIWSAGCATGEEPYSLAMLLCELLDPEEFRRRVKIYATDLDEAALATARRGMYLPRELENVPEALRSKYFEQRQDHYVITRHLRQAVIFGRNNIVHDPPISHIDLLLCRNLLIYLGAETQNRVLPRLHYALVDDGVLFLGKSETQLLGSKLFRPIDAAHRLFRKTAQPSRRHERGGVLFGGDPPADTAPAQHIRLLDAILNHSPAALLAIDRDDRLIFVSAGARRMLEIGNADVGRPLQELLISNRTIDLGGPIEQMRRQRRPVRIEHQEYRRPLADPIRLTVDLVPLRGSDGRWFATLLTFSDTTRLFDLQRELAAAQQSLETTVEELRSSNESLETTNEELLSTNEELETVVAELRSTNTELGATNEQLRSTNQEMEKTSQELHHRSDEFEEYRRGADALLRGIDAGLVIVDSALCVRSWNRWNETTWGVREEDLLGKVLLFVEIGLPVRQLEAELRAAAVEGVAGEKVVTARDQHGRTMTCLVRMWPVLRDDRTTQGVIVMVDER